MQPNSTLTGLRAEASTTLRAAVAPRNRSHALLRAGSPLQRNHRSTVAVNASKPGDIDMGPNRRASSAFQDMKNAQESYLSDEEEARKAAASETSKSGSSQKGSGEGHDYSAPESGTVREAAYPFDREHSATESEEEAHKQ